ncbi:hypothetical protein BB560_001643 [Smittium megazygosporum]|uniref:Uncharacterized protein n=1 Tax=Smittium megazygosporum TaxID=133381 RepID=A0A2T9ZH73_9FUNG|nr:hypothetical protein BB560_001643 [Smittium megazygosporum]
MRFKIKFEGILEDREFWYAVPKENQANSGSRLSNQKPSLKRKRDPTISELSDYIKNDFNIQLLKGQSLSLKYKGVDLFEKSSASDLIKPRKTISISVAQKSGIKLQKKAEAKAVTSFANTNPGTSAKSELDSNDFSPPETIKMTRRLTNYLNWKKKVQKKIQKSKKGKKSKTQESPHSLNDNSNDNKKDSLELGNNSDQNTENQPNAIVSQSSFQEKIVDSSKSNHIKFLENTSTNATINELDFYNESNLDHSTDTLKRKFENDDSYYVTNNHDNLLDGQNLQKTTDSTFIGSQPKNNYIITSVEHMDDYDPGWRDRKGTAKYNRSNPARFLTEKKFYQQEETENGCKEVDYECSTSDLFSTETAFSVHDFQNYNTVDETQETQYLAVENEANQDQIGVHIDDGNLNHLEQITDIQSQNGVYSNENYQEKGLQPVDKIPDSDLKSNKKSKAAGNKNNKTTNQNIENFNPNLSQTEISYYPEVTDPVSVNDIIAFKLIELGDDLTPIMSGYYIALVRSVFQNLNKLNLKFLSVPNKPNKNLDQQKEINKKLEIDFNMDLENLDIDHLTANPIKETREQSSSLQKILDSKTGNYDRDALLDIRLIKKHA